MDKTKIKNHIEALQEKHRKLAKQIEIMESTGSFDDMDLQYFKKEKLRIKDEIRLHETKLTS